MSEQEYLGIILAERIQMILTDMEAGVVMAGEEEWESRGVFIAGTFSFYAKMKGGELE